MSIDAIICLHPCGYIVAAVVMCIAAVVMLLQLWLCCCSCGYVVAAVVMLLQLSSGEVRVQFLDESVLSIQSSPMVVSFTDQQGHVHR